MRQRQVRESCKSGSWCCVLSPVRPADLHIVPITSRLQVDRDHRGQPLQMSQRMIRFIGRRLPPHPRVFLLWCGFNRCIMNNSHFPEFFMPAIRQMLIVCFACVWTTTASPRSSTPSTSNHEVRREGPLKIEFRPSMAQEEELREQLMSTPLPLTIRRSSNDAGEQNR